MIPHPYTCCILADTTRQEYLHRAERDRLTASLHRNGPTVWSTVSHGVQRTRLWIATQLRPRDTSRAAQAAPASS